MFAAVAVDFQAADSAAVWGVYLPGLPKIVSTLSADEDAVFYIYSNRHTRAIVQDGRRGKLLFFENPENGPVAQIPSKICVLPRYGSRNSMK